LKTAWFFFFLLLTTLTHATTPFFSTFTPPKGWLLADPSKLDEGTEVGFIESTRTFFSPSISLTIETIGEVDLTTYTNVVQGHYQDDRTHQCRLLGTIKTPIGKGSLLQIDIENKWGEIRILQAITLHAGHALIHTAACLKKDFLRMHQTFLSSFQTLAVYPSLFASIKSPEFHSKVENMKTCWNKYTATTKGDNASRFISPFFQNNQWNPLVNFVEKELVNKGLCWQFLALKYLRETLVESIQ